MLLLHAHGAGLVGLGAFLAPTWPQEPPKKLPEPPEKHQEAPETASKSDFGAILVDFLMNVGGYFD